MLYGIDLGRQYKDGEADTLLQPLFVGLPWAAKNSCLMAHCEAATN